jgi:hypothetical protein
MKHSVVDDFLDRKEFEVIQDKLLYGGIPWYYSSNVSGDKNDSDFYFASILYDHMSGSRSEFLNVVLPIIAVLQPTILIRVKANLYPNTGKQIRHEFHRDYTFSHQGAIFYVNDNNGPTVLDDGTEIMPKKNRMLFFDPSELHGSVSSTDASIRMNVNFNYLKFY